MAELLRLGLSKEGLAVDTAGTGEHGLEQAATTTYDAIVLDLMLPGINGFETCRRLREHGIWSPAPSADRTRLRRGSSRRVGQRCRRLRGQAVRVRRTARPAARARPPGGGQTAERAHCREDLRPTRPHIWCDGEMRRSVCRPGSSRCWRRSCADRTRRCPASSCSSGSGTRLGTASPTWSTCTCATFERRSMSRSADALSRPSAGRVTAFVATAGRCSNNVPIRVRVAGAFAVAMALVLVTTGWLLYNRVSSSLLTELDNQLEVRAHDLTDVVKDPEDSLEQSGASKVELGESYAQLVDTRGNVVDASQWLARRPVLTPAELKRARSGPIFVVRGALPRLDEPSRALATHVDQNGKPMVLIVGSTLGNRAETLADLRDELLIAGPIALVLATVAGYFLAGLSLRPVDRMRSRAVSISADTPGERLPVLATRDEVQRLGETLNAMLDRLESALERERGFVADAGHGSSHPARLVADRTRTGIATRRVAGGAAHRRPRVVPGGRPARPAGRRSAPDRRVGSRAAAASGRRAPDASEVLASTARRFEWRAQGSEREISGYPKSGDRVCGDRVRLEQALGNLVDNALRHGEGVVGNFLPHGTGTWSSCT